MSTAGSEQSSKREVAGSGYDYRRDCGCDFERAVGSVESALAKHGFAVEAVHDIQATLEAKGFRIKPLRIYEVVGRADPTGPRPAGHVTADPRAARLMPCRVSVFVDAKTVAVTVLRPTLMCHVFPEERLDDVAAALERVLVAMVDEAAG